jgi:hypothetical protein
MMLFGHLHEWEIEADDVPANHLYLKDSNRLKGLIASRYIAMQS